MRKHTIIYALICTAVLMLIASACSGSGADITIDTTLSVTSSGSGTREMKVRIPKPKPQNSAKEQQLDDLIASSCPKELLFNRASTEDSIVYLFYLNFKSYRDYSEKLTGILGFNPGVIAANHDTILTKGTRIQENFSSENLLRFLIKSVEGYKASSAVRVQSNPSTVSIDGKSTLTDKYIRVNAAESVPIDSINIETQNNKDGTYNRTVVFRIPRSSMEKLGRDIYTYMGARVQGWASSGWEDYPSGSEFTVSCENVNSGELQKNTNTLLNSQDCGSVNYRVSNGNTAVLSEEYEYNEVLDLSSYSGENNSAPTTTYKYSVEGEDTDIFSARSYLEGSWANSKELTNDSTVFNGKAFGMRVCVPDGYTYEVEQTVITLESIGNNEFKRTVSFLYPKGETRGPNYTREFVDSLNLGFEVLAYDNGDNRVCDIVLLGTVEEITSRTAALFGEGNSLGYQNNANRPISLHNTSTLVDDIKMSGIYLKENKDSPMYYTIKADGTQMLDNVSYRDENTGNNKVNVRKSSEQEVTFKLSSHDSTVFFDSETPNIVAVVFAILAAIAVIYLVIFIIFKMKKGGFKNPPPPPTDKLRNINKQVPSQEEIKDVLSRI